MQLHVSRLVDQSHQVDTHCISLRPLAAGLRHLGVMIDLRVVLLIPQPSRHMSDTPPRLDILNIQVHLVPHRMTKLGNRIRSLQQF